MSHPNKRNFLGILTFADTPSDTSPLGAQGHRIVIPSAVIEAALPSLIGMGVNYSGEDKHAPREKCGVITHAWLNDKEVLVYGYVYPIDFPDLISISACSEELGMSFELHDAHITDMRTPIWEVSRMCFLGAAVMRKGKTAWKKTEFTLL